MVIGTPAEEGGGGKIRLLEAGVFDGVDATLSSHPFSNRTIIPATSPKGESWSLAMVGYRYMYHGKAAHAAAYPEAGINALNAVIHLFTGIDALRQHLRDDVRIHGVITDGGTGAQRGAGVRRRQLHAALPGRPVPERRGGRQGKRGR